MNNTSIIVKNVSVKLQGKTLLDGISFQLLPGENLVIVGAAASGKSLLAKALCGQVVYEGEIIASATILVEQTNRGENAAHVAAYYQQRYNNRSFDVRDEIFVIDELHAICKDDNAIDKWLQQLGIAHCKNSLVLQLSSGENKRFQLVKALLQQPEILILDNPFIGLDINTRKQLHGLINDLAVEGTTIIIVTEANEIPLCATVVAVLESGKLKNFIDKNDFISSASFHTSIAKHKRVTKELPVSITEHQFATAVKMVDVNVKYADNHVLKNINWKINRGDKWLLRGHNGAGKTTLLSLITADNPQGYANEIYLFDKRRGSGESIWDIKQQIGFVSPELHWCYDKNVTCYNTVASGFFDTIGLFKQLNAEQIEAVQKWLEFFGLSEVKNKQLSMLSTGQQRLALLARAFVKDPPLLILDEPCQGLNQEQIDHVIELVDELCTRLNKTLIYVSHYDNEIPTCINKTLELKHGQQIINSLKKEIAA